MKKAQLILALLAVAAASHRKKPNDPGFAGELPKTTSVTDRDGNALSTIEADMTTQQGAKGSQ